MKITLGRPTETANPVNPAAKNSDKKGGASMNAHETDEMLRAQARRASQATKRQAPGIYPENIEESDESAPTLFGGTGASFEEAVSATAAASGLNSDNGTAAAASQNAPVTQFRSGTQGQGKDMSAPIPSFLTGPSGTMASPRNAQPAQTPTGSSELDGLTKAVTDLARTVTKLSGSVNGRLDKFESDLKAMGGRLDGLSQQVQGSPAQPSPQRLGAGAPTSRDFLTELEQQTEAEERVLAARPVVPGFWLGAKFYPDEDKLKAGYETAVAEWTGSKPTFRRGRDYEAGYAFVDTVVNGSLAGVALDKVGAIKEAKPADDRAFKLYELRLRVERQLQHRSKLANATATAGKDFASGKGKSTPVPTGKD